MPKDNIRVLRWWVFSDLRAGITIDGNGMPTGLESTVFQDFQDAINIANNYSVHIVPVLFDFSMMNNADIVDEVQLGGRTYMLTNATVLAALISNVINPLLKEFSNEPTIYAWEIMNEPEWAISDIPSPAVNSGLQPVTQAQFWSFASQVSNSIHTYTNSYAIIGSACLKWYKIWTNDYATTYSLPLLNLDFYETHFYSWMNGQSTSDPVLGDVQWSPLYQDYNLLNLDHPMVVGEYNDGANNTALVLTVVLQNNFAGAWVWSFGQPDGILSNWGLFDQWGTNYSSIIYPPTSSSIQGQTGQTSSIQGQTGQTNKPVSVATSIAQSFLFGLFLLFLLL